MLRPSDSVRATRPVAPPAGQPQTSHTGLSGRAWAGSASREPISLGTHRRLRVICLETVRTAGSNATRPDDGARYGAAFEGAVAEIGRRGSCVVEGDWRPNLAAVAVPLRRTVDGLQRALNLAVPRFDVPRDTLVGEFGPRLVGVARSIEDWLGLDAGDAGRRGDVAARAIAGRAAASRHTSRRASRAASPAATALSPEQPAQPVDRVDRLGRRIRGR